MFKTVVSVSTISTLGILTALAAGYGCSSSTSSTTSPDAGGTTEGDSGAHTNPSDSGSQGITDAGAGSSDGGGSQGNNDSGTTAQAPACYSDPADYTALTAAPTLNSVIATPPTCAPADIQAWVSAYVDNDNDGGAAWVAANLAGGQEDGGGAGTACGNCLAPFNSDGTPNNGGPIFWTYWGTGAAQNAFIAPNYGACMQVLDTTNGPACSVAFDNINDCNAVACEVASGAGQSAVQCKPTPFNTCTTYADGTGQPCAAANTAFQTSTACATDFGDGGAYTTCTPGEAADGGGGDQDFAYVANLLCGTGAP